MRDCERRIYTNSKLVAVEGSKSISLHHALNLKSKLMTNEQKIEHYKWMYGQVFIRYDANGILEVISPNEIRVEVLPDGEKSFLQQYNESKEIFNKWIKIVPTI